MSRRINAYEGGFMTVVSVVEPVRCAKSTVCENRLELLVDPGMSSQTLAKWAHAAVDNWLASRVDLTSPAVYDVGTVKGSGNG